MISKFGDKSDTAVTGNRMMKVYGKSICDVGELVI